MMALVMVGLGTAACGADEDSTGATGGITPVASVAPAPPAVSLAASAPAQVPASKPDDNDSQTASDVLNDAAIAALIIQASREAYYTAGHSCPCPYDLAPNGRLCGHHSAHTRHRGGALRCFATDVTADQIAGYRAKLASK